MRGLFASGFGLFGAPNSNGGTGTGVPVLQNSPTIITPNIIGITNGSNAAAGSVGEVITGTVASDAAVAMVDGQAKDFTHIALTAGDWDIYAVGILTGAIADSVIQTIFIGTASGNNTTGQDTAANTVFLNAFTATNITGTIHYRVNITSPTTYYLKGIVSAVNISAYGTIQARRAR